MGVTTANSAQDGPNNKLSHRRGGARSSFLVLVTVLFLLGEYLGSFCTKSHQSA